MSLFKKIIYATALSLSFIAMSFFAYAQFVEPGSTPVNSVQDWAQNILGANNNNNAFDSSNVNVNKDGSVIEMLEYLSGKASSSQYFVGGENYFCQKKSVDNTGFTSTTDINNGQTCLSEKECANGACLTAGGYACLADGDCADANCDSDFDSATKYCHATSTDCINGPGESVSADGYELCSGDSYYKSCSSSVWGSATYPEDTYCDAGGGANSGYSASTTKTCSSGASGGFNSGTCSTACDPHKAATTNSCMTTCANDSDCWSTSSCYNNDCVGVCSASTPCGTPCMYNLYIYHSSTVGSACWFDEGIDSAGNRLKGAVTQVLPSNNSVVEKYCYSDSDANCTSYRALYTWSEALNLSSACANSTCAGSISSPHQGICPNGWHVPTETELTTALSAGLNVPFYGYKFNGGGYYELGSYGYLCTTGEASATNGRFLRKYSGGGTIQSYNKTTGTTLRCVKD